MKKLCNAALAAAMVCSLAGCNNEQTTTNTDDPVSGIELNVTTTYAGEDGNAQNFKDAVKAFEEENNITIVDTSATSDESFKTRVITDFETGSEPDVLFFFNGADANDIVSAGKVVSIDEIRKEYKDYASNMNDELIVASPVDDKKYAVPVNGFWEAMFVNKEVLDACSVEMPDANTTWADFLDICDKIKEAGYTPIACALGNIPHYWWEYGIFNHTSPKNHLEIPTGIDTANGRAWVDGLTDIKEAYELGYFPENTLTATDDETFAMFTQGKAAFLVDGSWKVGGIVNACQSDPDDPTTLDSDKLSHFDVTYIPGNGDRKSTDLIGGLSMGYYITKKAWDDEAKRDAAVKFVEFMTSDALVPVFAQHTATALKNAPAVDEKEFNPLQVKAMEMMSGVTSLTPAAQDLFNGECRISTFDGMPEIVTGKVSVEDAVEEGLNIYKEMNE